MIHETSIKTAEETKEEIIDLIDDIKQDMCDSYEKSAAYSRILQRLEEIEGLVLEV